MRKLPSFTIFALACGLLGLSGCSLTSVIIRAAGSSQPKNSGPGALSVFMRENDPEIVAASLPTLIKTMEALLATEPKEASLALSVGSAYVMYANAFVDGPANLLSDDFYEEKARARSRAKNFYVRGANFIGEALERSFPGITTDEVKAKAYLTKLKKKWVPYVYWYSAGTCAGFGLDPMDIALSMRVPQAKLMLDRAFELEPGFMDGAIADFFISFHASMPDTLGGDKSLVKPMYQRALELNKGSSPGSHVAYAMGVSVPNQDVVEFRSLMEKALAINPDDHPDSRLMIILSQRNARYRLDNIGDLFITE